MSRSPDDKQYWLGQYMTPEPVAEWFFDHVVEAASTWRVLDPACGDGNLLLAAARRMVAAGVTDVASRLCGVDIDPEMVERAKHRISLLLAVPPESLNLFQGDYLAGDDTLFGRTAWAGFDASLVLSNPPYGQGREYAFFEHMLTTMPRGTRTVFLVPLAFMDRLEGGRVDPLDGRPLGVTTGHCLVSLVVGDPWRLKSVHAARSNRSGFNVFSGVKVYEKGAGIPPQSDAVVEAKPYSSNAPVPGWLPCVRTGDVQPEVVRLDRQWINWGPHLAHPKELDRFTGPRLFVRRVPIWANRQLGAAYVEEQALCAGDVLVVRHETDDTELLKGLCRWLNSPPAADAVLLRRPSVKHRMSFPKISAKDLNMLFDNDLPPDDVLRSLARAAGAVSLETRGAAGVRASLGDFPVAAVCDASVKEKSVRHGHLSTLQFWWARRPLATCRAVLYSLLRPNAEQVSANPELRARLVKAMPLQPDDAARIDALSGPLSEWAATDDKALLALARDLIMLGRAKAPVVFDPFGGGGSVPVEALRLGLDAITGELHPVAAAALQLAIEDLPRGGRELVDDYVTAAAEVGRRLATHQDRLYPSKNVPLAYLWCRTFVCASCGAVAPLLRDRHLARSPRSAVIKVAGAPGSVAIRVVPIASPEDVEAASEGTVSDRGATCAGCNQKVDADFLRREGKANRLGDLLYAVHELMPNGERTYRDPLPADLLAAADAHSSREVPSVDLDWNGVRHLWTLQYGINTTSDLHLPRQREALCIVVQTIRDVVDEISSRRGVEEARAIAVLLALTLNRLVMYGNKHAWWQSNGEFPANIFVRQAISMVWSYVEMPITSPGASGWDSASEWVRKVALHLSALPRAGRAFMADASKLPLNDGSVDIVFSDPPYYDSITYGYLADVFVGWMRAVVGDRLSGPLRDLPINRAEEAIVDRPHALAPNPKDDQHFRAKMLSAFGEMRRVLAPGGTVVLMYGHKKTSAWAAFLEPLLASGLIPVESWPMQTERKAKFRHNRISALSTSCLIVCKPSEDRPNREPLLWSAFEERLVLLLTGAVEQFEARGVHGADLGVALLAPAVAEWARFEVHDDAGRDVAVSVLFERLPDLARRCELLSLERQLETAEGALFVEEIRGIAAGVSTANSIFVKELLAHGEALADGRVAAADLIASRHPQSRLLGAVRLMALHAAADSRPEQLALASVGRLSMQGLGQLPGSGFAPD